MRVKYALGMMLVGLMVPTVSHAAWKFYNAADTNDVPTLLSQTGFYSNWEAKTVTPEAAFYEVNSALWSDGAHKSRWLILPPGKKIVFNEQKDYWDYPDSAVFVKLFKLEQIPGDPASEVYWETRVLVNKEDSVSHIDEWYGFSYKWKADGSDAILLRPSEDDSALNMAFTYWPQGKSKPSRIKKWRYPDRFQCLQCHRTASSPEGIHGRSVLGFFTAQINRPSKADPSVNQITEFFKKGHFIWENKSATQPMAGEIALMPRWYGITDSAQDLNHRARAYIAANCSGCHGERGIAVGAPMGRTLNYDFWSGKAKMIFTKQLLGSDFGIDGASLLIPGAPEKSIILYRQIRRATYDLDLKAWNEDTSSTKPAKPDLIFYPPQAQMPQLGSFEVDTMATKVIAKWITTFDTTIDNMAQVAIRHAAQKPALQVPVLDSRHLTIPVGMTGRVALLGVNGRAYPIVRIAGNQYAVPTSLRRGLYIVRVGSSSFTQYLY
jgi:hypothetical protein